MKIINQKNVFEFVPAITFYKNRGGEYKKGTLTIAWLSLALQFNI
jgi:hypothetical protein